MIKLEEITITYKNYYGNEYYNNSYIIAKKDVEDLKTWLQGSEVKFNGKNGKVFFHTDTEFPRYKFTEYSRNNNNVVKRVKKIDNCDVIVLDIDRYVKILDNVLRSKEVVLENLNKTDKGFDCYKVIDQKITLNDIERLTIHKYNADIVNTLSILIELYNNNNSIKSVKVQDLNDIITKNCNPIGVDMSQQIDRLFLSNDPDSIKLAMEFLTNSDFEASLFHIILLCGKHCYKMRQSTYWNSTSFRTFRDMMSNKGVNIEYLNGNDTIKSVETFLSIKGNKYLYEDDIDYIKECIKIELDETYTFDNSGYIIKNYEIELNIDQKQIIKRDSIKEENEEVEVSDTTDAQTDFILTD